MQAYSSAVVATPLKDALARLQFVRVLNKSHVSEYASQALKAENMRRRQQLHLWTVLAITSLLSTIAGIAQNFFSLTLIGIFVGILSVFKLCLVVLGQRTPAEWIYVPQTEWRRNRITAGEFHSYRLPQEIRDLEHRIRERVKLKGAKTVFYGLTPDYWKFLCVDCGNEMYIVAQWP